MSACWVGPASKGRGRGRGGLGMRGGRELGTCRRRGGGGGGRRRGEGRHAAVATHVCIIPGKTCSPYLLEIF